MKTWYSITAKAAQPAEISIFDEIGFWGVTAKSFIDELRLIKAASINLSINSPGGSVFDALAIFNALRQHPAEINVTIMGVAASAASLVAMAGDRIVMPENTFMMVHNPIGAANGNSDDMRDLADILDKIGQSLVATYVARTGQSEDSIRALLDAETWMSAAEAEFLGFCDEVQAALKIAAAFDCERLPENVRAALKGNDAEPSDQAMFGDTIAEPAAQSGTDQGSPSPIETLCAGIVAKAESAGLIDFADTWLVDPRIIDIESAGRIIDEAREIRSIGDFLASGRRAETGLMNPQEIRAFVNDCIRNRCSLAQARERLCNELAARDERIVTDSHQPTPQYGPAASGSAAWTKFLARVVSSK